MVHITIATGYSMLLVLRVRVLLSYVEHSMLNTKLGVV